MSLDLSENTSTFLEKFNRFKPWLFGSLMLVGLSLILSLEFIRGDQVSATLGLPSPERIEAPFDLEYTSDLRTQQARDEAALGVPDAYTELDRSIGEDSVRRGKQLIAFVRTVRADPTATEAWKLDALSQVESVDISALSAQHLIDIDDLSLEAVDGDIERMINTLMLNQIRESELSQVGSVVQRQVRFNTPAEQEAILLDVVPQLIAANTFFDPISTEALRADAVESVVPVLVNVQQGEVLLQEGQRVTDLDLEMLQAYNLLQSDVDVWDIGRNILISAITTFLIAIYYVRFHKPIYLRNRYLILYSLFFLGFVLTAHYMIAGTIYAYLFPAAALAILISVIFDTRFAIFTMVLLAGIVGYIADNSLEMMYYTIVGAVIAVFSLRDSQRIMGFFRAGLLAGVGNLFVLGVFSVNEALQPFELVQLALAALGSGLLASSLALGAFYVASALFRITTVLQLQELSRFDNPVLQELLHRAPGTYHHSIMVANLAEQAADNIEDASSLLVRVGAFYHDIGKLVNAPYFSENQEGENPHKTLPPQESARIIINHVTDGLQMAKKYRLPERVQDFIREHHGDQTLTYFYNKAVEQSGSLEDSDVVVVDPAAFKYPGPAPQSKETGIVLLADAVEATSKAVQPNNEAAIVKLVRKITSEMMANDQLDESGLTMGDIRIIRESFTETLKGRYHVRIKYQGNDDLIAANTPSPAVEGEVVDEAAPATQPPPISALPLVEPDPSS